MANNDKKYKKNGLTPEKLMAYLETKSGKSQRQVGREMGRDHKTVSRWTGEIEDYIKSSPEYKEAGPVITGLIPKAFGVYNAKLDLNDLNAARDVLKMAVIFVERKQVESSDAITDDSDLYAELGELIGSDTDVDATSESESVEDSQGTETPED